MSEAASTSVGSINYGSSNAREGGLSPWLIGGALVALLGIVFLLTKGKKS
jgi:hypothetical protein